MDWYGWPMGWMWLWWCLAAMLFVVGIWYASTRRGDASGSEDSAEEILRRRYARGEIDRDTFERMRHDLRGHDGREKHA